MGIAHHHGMFKGCILSGNARPTLLQTYNCFFALFTTRLLRYVLRTVLAYVQNAPGILVRPSRQKVSFVGILTVTNGYYLLNVNYTINEGALKYSVRPL